MTYVRRGAQVDTNLGHTVTSSRNSLEVQNTVNINNVLTRDVTLDDLTEVPEEAAATNNSVYDPDTPHKGYTSQELWTIPVLKRIINAINNAYFNVKLIDNIILVDDMEAILSQVVGKEVKILLEEPSDKCRCLGKFNCICDIFKITVNDNGTQTNFKYAYNDVYESMAIDFRINMTKVFTKF